MGSIIVGGIVAVAAGFALRASIKRAKSGGCGCSGGSACKSCAGCTAAGSAGK